MRHSVSIQETDNQPSLFNNANMSVAVTRQPDCMVKLDVTINSTATLASYAKAVKNINKEVSLPGFRKGKAPEDFVRKNFKAQIEKEWIDVVLQTSFSDALHLIEIYPLKEGSIKRPVIHKCSKEEGASFTIEFETRPLIPAIDLTNIELKKVEKNAITPDKVAQTLSNLRVHYGEWTIATDRPVQEGDFVDLNVDILETPEHSLLSDSRVDVSDKETPEWLRRLVIGMNAGESKESTENITPPSSGEPENPVKLRVTIKNIWTVQLPDVNEDFAKKLGASTVEELDKKILSKLEQEALQDLINKESKELEDFLIQHYSFELPRSYIEEEAEAQLRHHLDKLSKANYSKEAIEQHKEEISRSIENRAKRNLQLLFLLRKVAADHNIEINPEDITQELSRQISLMASGQSSIDFQMDHDTIKNRIQYIALDNKIKQFLLDKARFVE